MYSSILKFFSFFVDSWGLAKLAKVNQRIGDNYFQHWQGWLECWQWKHQNTYKMQVMTFSLFVAQLMNRMHCGIVNFFKIKPTSKTTISCISVVQMASYSKLNYSAIVICTYFKIIKKILGVSRSNLFKKIILQSMRWSFDNSKNQNFALLSIRDVVRQKSSQ